MTFFDHLESEFAYTKQIVLYSLRNLPRAKKIVINIGVRCFTHDTGLINIRTLDNIIKDIADLITTRANRHIIIVVSDYLHTAKLNYLKSPDIPMVDNINTNFISSLSCVFRNDLANLFLQEFSKYSLKTIDFSLSTSGTENNGELDKTLKKIKEIIFSKNFNDETKKISALKDLLNSKQNVLKEFSQNITIKNMAKTFNELFRHFPETIPVIMEDVSQKNNMIEEDDEFAARIARAVDADVMVSISKKGMLFTTDPSKEEITEPFYCYDTGRKPPFDKVRMALLSKKLNAASRVNNHRKPIPMILTAYNGAYTISNIFDKNKLSEIYDRGDFPNFTLFINSNAKQLIMPIELRDVSGIIMIDDNAEKALLNEKRSLLAAGVIRIEGTFNKNSVVKIINPHSHEMAKGVVNYNSNEIENFIRMKESNNKTSEIINRSKMRFLKQS